MKKIMMFARPGGTLGFTFDQHVIGLNSDKKKRYLVSIASNSTTIQDIEDHDILWFYAKAFHPSVFENLRRAFPGKFFIVGPNVLLDKPDVGISDEWDDWLINKAEFDLHLDQVEFYNDHVKKFFPVEKRKLSTHLDKCMRLEIFDTEVEDSIRDIDCLIYSKKRRYDYHFDSFRKNIIEGLEKLGINYKEVVYGNYRKDDFLKTLLKTKVMLNLSLDECPGILNYEAFYCNTHVIGSSHNCPSHYDEKMIVKNTDFMTEKYLVRKPEAADDYLDKLSWFLKEGEKESLRSPREFVLNHTSYQRYCDDLWKILGNFKKI